jgi:hypothetical protein
MAMMSAGELKRDFAPAEVIHKMEVEERLRPSTELAMVMRSSRWSSSSGDRRCSSR